MSTPDDNTQYVPPTLGRDVPAPEICNDPTALPYSELHVLGTEFKVSSALVLDEPVASREPSVKLSAFMMRRLKDRQQHLQNTELGNVLHLDCFGGFAGIAAMRIGYQHIVFSDVNPQLLASVTWPNIVLNCPWESAKARCVECPNWIALSEHLSRPGERKWHPEYMQFDLVLVTLPSVQHFALWEKLHCLLRRHLTPTGTTLVALRTSTTRLQGSPRPPDFVHSLLQSGKQTDPGTVLYEYDIVKIGRR